MIYWIREAAGWLLVGLGLLVFLGVWECCEQQRYFPAMFLTGIGIIVFRGGIHLLKVAVAGRICRQTQNQLYPAQSGSGPRPTVRRPERPTRPREPA
jgi:hypothetical protein